MTQTLKKHFECADNSELAAHYGIRVFPLCWNTARDEKKPQAPTRNQDNFIWECLYCAKNIIFDD